jgi:hypothetical protein
MYATLLFLHSWLRWLVLIVGIAVLLYTWTGFFSGRAFGARARAITKVFVGVLDVQLLVGLVLYAVYSPLTHAAFANMRFAMKEPSLRFWTVEHGPPMLLAVVLAHVGSVRARRAPTDKLRYRRFGTWALAAFVLMFFATPWPWLDVGRPLIRW